MELAAIWSQQGQDGGGVQVGLLRVDEGVQDRECAREWRPKSSFQKWTEEDFFNDMKNYILTHPSRYKYGTYKYGTQRRSVGFTLSIILKKRGSSVIQTKPKSVKYKSNYQIINFHYVFCVTLTVLFYFGEMLAAAVEQFGTFCTSTGFVCLEHSCLALITSSLKGIIRVCTNWIITKIMYKNRKHIQYSQP